MKEKIVIRPPGRYGDKYGEYIPADPAKLINWVGSQILLIPDEYKDSAKVYIDDTLPNQTIGIFYIGIETDYEVKQREDKAKKDADDKLAWESVMSDRNDLFKIVELDREIKIKSGFRKFIVSAFSVTVLVVLYVLLR